MHAVLVALLGALIAIQIVKRVGSLPAALDLALALAAGLGLAWVLVVRRARLAHTFVTVLSPAPVVFLLLFLLGSGVTQLVLPEDAKVAAPTERRGPPVVMVVFDEFPLTSLLDRDGKIDAVRYPNFATLAGRSTWYSHATTVFDSTTHAVPGDPRRAPAARGVAADARPPPEQPLHAARPVVPPQRVRGGVAPVPAEAVPERRSSRASGSGCAS